VEILVKPDPTLLLAKRSTVQDVKDAYDRGEVSGDYFREVLGIPSWAAPSDEERARRQVIGIDKEEGGHSPTTETPRQRGARADREDPSGAPSDQKTIDPTILAEWRGKIDVATFRARDRLGAKARTHASLRDVCPSSLSNAAVPAHLGLHALESAGIDAASVVSDSLLFLGPRSCAGDNLVDGLTEHVLATLDSTDPVALQDEDLAKLLQGLANSPE
jgi:hypothetical protein